jgi:hypothetical protein
MSVGRVDGPCQCELQRAPISILKYANCVQSILVPQTWKVAVVASNQWQTFWYTNSHGPYSLIRSSLEICGS